MKDNLSGLSRKQNRWNTVQKQNVIDVYTNTKLAWKYHDSNFDSKAAQEGAQMRFWAGPSYDITFR